MWAMPVEEQVNSTKMDNLIPDRISHNLCHSMEGCPVYHTPDGHREVMPCTGCIGLILLEELKAIEPELVKGNLAKTIHIWEILVK